MCNVSFGVQYIWPITYEINIDQCTFVTLWMINYLAHVEFIIILIDAQNLAYSIGHGWVINDTQRRIHVGNYQTSIWRNASFLKFMFQPNIAIDYISINIQVKV